MSSEQQISGNANNLIQGYNNTIQTGSFNVPSLTKSDIADLLNSVKKIQKKAAEEKEISLPKGLNEKLRFNNVEDWKNIFDSDCPYYNDIVEVMESFSASSDITIQLNTMFYMLKSGCMSGDKINGDSLLTRMSEKLNEEIKNSSAYRNKESGEARFSNADIILFVNSLLKRAVVECKVLLVPKDGNEG